MTTNAPYLFRVMAILAFSTTMAAPQAASADHLFWEGLSENGTAALEEELQVSLMLTIAGKPVNALQARVVFPNTVIFEQVRSGGTIVSLWVERPAIRDNAVTFSGIIPGGFSGTGLIVTVIVRAEKPGAGVIEADDLLVLLNDCRGTSVPVSYEPARIRVADQQLAEAPEELLDDHEPPEAFTPLISRHQDIFDNQWFAVFHTHDKGSGVNYYALQERLVPWPSARRWREVESPSVLRSQWGLHYTWIKAVDFHGNERRATVPPRILGDWGRIVMTNESILIVLLLGIIMFTAWRWRRFKTYTGLQ